jgi:hypothetical protein
MFGTSSNDTQAAGAVNPEPAVIPDNPFADSPANTVSPAPQAMSPLPEPVINQKPVAAEPTMPAASNDSLMSLKQEALQSLQPLVTHLDQTPEEKFKTTMMMIQATDNPSLVKEAYAAANQITDEKARAQALLDVVNEINYFTHKDEK